MQWCAVLCCAVQAGQRMMRASPGPGPGSSRCHLPRRTKPRTLAAALRIEQRAEPSTTHNTAAPDSDIAQSTTHSALYTHTITLPSTPLHHLSNLDTAVWASRRPPTWHGLTTPCWDAQHPPPLLGQLTFTLPSPHHPASASCVSPRLYSRGTFNVRRVLLLSCRHIAFSRFESSDRLIGPTRSTHRSAPVYRRRHSTHTTAATALTPRLPFLCCCAGEEVERGPRGDSGGPPR